MSFKVTVLQMTFDIEHYMAEAIHHDADWGQRYVAFCNYDLQILDVSPVFLYYPLVFHIFAANLFFFSLLTMSI